MDFIEEARQQQRDALQINFNTGGVRAGIRVYTLKDNDYFINYVPALNLSSYGSTPEDADSMMLNAVLVDYFECLLKLSKGRVAQELGRLGWVTTGGYVGSFENSAYVDVNGILQNFNLPQDTEIKESVLTV